MIDALVFFWTWMLANPLMAVLLVGAFVAGLIVFVRTATAVHRRDGRGVSRANSPS